MDVGIPCARTGKVEMMMYNVQREPQPHSSICVCVCVCRLPSASALDHTTASAPSRTLPTVTSAPATSGRGSICGPRAAFLGRSAESACSRSRRSAEREHSRVSWGSGEDVPGERRLRARRRACGDRDRGAAEGGDDDEGRRVAHCEITEGDTVGCTGPMSTTRASASECAGGLHSWYTDTPVGDGPSTEVIWPFMSAAGGRSAHVRIQRPCPVELGRTLDVQRRDRADWQEEASAHHLRCAGVRYALAEATLCEFACMNEIRLVGSGVCAGSVRPSPRQCDRPGLRTSAALAMGTHRGSRPPRSIGVCTSRSRFPLQRAHDVSHGADPQGTRGTLRTHGWESTRPRLHQANRR